ncbi:SAP30-binding protein-like [Hydractinia symbiolongicarpus]|uniref:SAP30-binding protein-like n=1 Tax=Hydractinia symbiolongicarpus TaxID=13093 RepID=UPI00254FA914|nr:SAP30-binding protein-like [Hydractinia symbiolongicarpus]
MSLNALSRYDDAEDEINDADHNLVISAPPVVQTYSPEEKTSRPSSVLDKPKGLVSYFGGSDEDITSSEDEAGDDNNTPVSKSYVVNLGLYDGLSVMSSTGSASPGSLNENIEKEDRGKEQDDGVRLPPEPEGRCSKSLQEKVAKMIEKNVNVNEYVQRKKEFRNPSIYEKLVSFIGIDEHGTNFPRHLYDPTKWGPQSYYDALAKKQKEHHDKKEKEKLKEKRTQVEFITSTKKPISSASSGTTEKKSKWDQKVLPIAK